jgi:hypothetical protein
MLIGEESSAGRQYGEVFHDVNGLLIDRTLRIKAMFFDKLLVLDFLFIRHSPLPIQRRKGIVINEHRTTAHRRVYVTR